MLRASALIGVAAAGGGEAITSAAERYADGVGLAFQIRDDMLDALGDEKTLGKPIGSDSESGKTTFFTLFGEAECRRIIEEETDKAVAAIRDAFPDAGFLVWLARELAGRTF